MRTLGFVAAGCVLLGLAGAGRSDEADKKGNKEKLVGTWERVKGTLPEGATVEFTKDGKITIKAKNDEGKEVTVTGTYEVTGDKIKLQLKVDDKEHKETLRIKKLTDTVLITLDEKDKTDELKKRAKK